MPATRSAPCKDPSETYRLIWQAMHNRQRIACEYQGLPRQGCPIILGYSEIGREAVKLYQVGGETSRGQIPAWRDFYLDEIRDFRTAAGAWQEGTSHKQAQAFVKFVDVDTNIPDTLTRTEPLPFGSPLLRRPRGR